MTDHQGKPREIAIEGRDGEVWKRYTRDRWTQERIARELGVTQQRVSQIVRSVREAIPDHDLAEMRQQSIDFYSQMIAQAMEIADMTPAPVFVGKDGDPARDPENDNALVRDYSGRLRAMETAAKFEGELRKLMGLDAATKVESTATVRYEIAGVDPDALT